VGNRDRVPDAGAGATPGPRIRHNNFKETRTLFEIKHQLGVASIGGRPCERGVKVKKSKSKDKVWRAAEAALAAAQQMPGGPARAAALKEAGQLRLKADDRRLRKEQRARDKTE
jgi:hypothetical protein